MNGKFIGTVENTNVFTIQKEFTLEKIEKAVLTVTALGLYVAHINGQRVGDAYLTPGWTSYQKMLQYQEYDVTNLLKNGVNTISLTVNNGWYSGYIGCPATPNLWGDKTAALAQLELSDSNGNCHIISTDESWQAKESHIVFSGIYEGETQDFTKECKELSVCEVEYDKKNLVKQICEPVKNIERLSPKNVFTSPKGEVIYDFGQNLVGVVEIITPDSFDGTIRLKFAEILTTDGNFYTENLRGALSTDTFTVKGKRVISPEFTFHGFRYLTIQGGEIPSENITAIVRHTDMERTGKITSSNKRFSRLMDNIVWGQRGNFVDVPTDCPQRDERLGWTGDANIFCRTAAYNYDVRKFFKKWLADVRNEQLEDGEIPFVIPDALGKHFSGAGWSSCITMIPWTLYEMYGDITFLEENYEAMKKYLRSFEAKKENGLIVEGFEYGDWLSLDGDRYFGERPFGGTDEMLIANIFYAVSLKITAKSAKLLGKHEEALKIEDYCKDTINKIQAEYFTFNGRIVCETVTAQVLALHFDIVPQQHRERLARDLNKNVIKYKYHVITGFLGTPYLLFALADNGYFETARRVLMNHSYPGWFYEVDMGATTMWERWNSLLPNGTPNPDGMNSYNHYAYGAVQEFIYRRVAGIEMTDVGFKQVRIQPHPVKGICEFYAEYDSVNGKIKSSYRYADGKITYSISIPPEIRGEVYLEGQGVFEFDQHGKFEITIDSESLAEVPFAEEMYFDDVYNSPKVQRAFEEAFGVQFIADSNLDWMRTLTLKQLSEQMEIRGIITKADFESKLKKANRIFENI